MLPGDKIKVGRKGAARLVYSDDCSVPVEANSVERVSAHSPCSFKALSGDNNAPVYVPVGQDSGIPCDPFGPWDRWAPCALLLGLGGAAAGAALSEGGDANTPGVYPGVAGVDDDGAGADDLRLSMGAASFGADQGASRGRVGVFFYLAAVGLLSCLLLGGGTGSGYLSDAVLQLLSLPLLFAALWRILAAPRGPELRWALTACAAILAVPLLQLVPLPPQIWTHLPGRDAVLAAFALLGRAPAWAPISMAPRSTWLCALGLLPPLAVFLAVTTPRLARAPAVEPRDDRLRRGERLSRLDPAGGGADESAALFCKHQRELSGGLFRRRQSFRRAALLRHCADRGLAYDLDRRQATFSAKEA